MEASVAAWRLHVRRGIADLAVYEMNNDAVYLIIRLAARGKSSQARQETSK